MVLPCCFRSKTRGCCVFFFLAVYNTPLQDSSVTESSWRQSGPGRTLATRSSTASRSCFHVPRTGLPLQVGQFRVFCESVPRQILFFVLLVIPGAARGTRVLQFDKKIRSVPHFLQPPPIDKEPESNAKMYANQMA